MSELIHTDYYRFKWVVLEKKDTKTVSKKIILAIFFVAFSLIGLMYVVNQHLGFRSNEFFWLMAIFTLIVAVVLSVFSQRFNSFSTAQIWKYEISGQGLLVKDKNYPISLFGTSQIREMISQLTVQDWKKLPEGEGGGSELIFNLSRGRLRVLFPDEKTKIRLATSLKHYLETTSS